MDGGVPYDRLISLLDTCKGSGGAATVAFMAD